MLCQLNDYHVFPLEFAKEKKEKVLQNTILGMRTVMRNKDIIWSGLMENELNTGSVRLLSETISEGPMTFVF